MILAIETSGIDTGIAFVYEGDILYELSLRTEAKHNETIYELLDRAFHTLRTGVEKLRGVAVSLGPGMFTSLRVGISLAKGLCLPHNIPVIGINTLDALAYSVCPSPWLIAPLIDAKKREVFTAFYRDSKRVSDYMILKPERFGKEIREPALFLGNGLIKYRTKLKEILKEYFHSPKRNPLSPPPGIIGILGEEELRKGKRESIEELEPFYLRRTDAEVNRDIRDARIRP